VVKTCEAPREFFLDALLQPAVFSTADFAAFAAAVVLAAALTTGAIVIHARKRMRAIRQSAEQVRAEAARAQEHAKAADTAKSALVARVSHEIRAPMSGVIGVLDILEHTPLSAEQRHYLDLAHQPARLLLRVINDLLDYAKIESGTLKLCDAPYNFYAALENLAELHLPLARRKGLKLAVAIMPHFDRHLLGDEIRVAQVVANLVNNAIAFTQQGEIVISARRRLRKDGDHVEISVRDTGPGMSEEYQRRLFLPFQQEDTSTTRQQGGTGLGLSIVKHLVERMNGTVTIHSRPGFGTQAVVCLPARWVGRELAWPRHPGRTATMAMGNSEMTRAMRAWLSRLQVRRIAIPAQADVQLSCDTEGLVLAGGPIPCHTRFSLYAFLHALDSMWGGNGSLPALLGNARCPSTACSPRHSSSVSPSTSVRLLLIEDNEISRDITVRQLQLIGIQAHAANDGEAGYLSWLCHRPDVMLVDCHMPRLDGYELARRIRRHETINAWPRTKLIGFSANATMADAQACRAAGMDDYVAKPATRTTLREALMRAGVAGIAAAHPSAR
jgi:signal transduction histidine kinase/CheY-like chemotaxis protein